MSCAGDIPEVVEILRGTTFRQSFGGRDGAGAAIDFTDALYDVRIVWTDGTSTAVDVETTDDPTAPELVLDAATTGALADGLEGTLYLFAELASGEVLPVGTVRAIAKTEGFVPVFS